MAYEMKEDSGNLFRVAERKSDKHPEYDGEFKIRCPHCEKAATGWLSAWIREAKNGNKFFSISFKARRAQSQGGDV